MKGLIGTCAVVLACAALAAVPSEAAKKKLSAFERSPNCPPRTYLGAVKCLDDVLTRKTKTSVRTSAREDFVQYPFGLDRWMGSSFGLRREKGRLPTFFRAQGVTEPRGMTTRILAGYWLSLQGCKRLLELYVDAREGTLGSESTQPNYLGTEGCPVDKLGIYQILWPMEPAQGFGLGIEPAKQIGGGGG